MFDLKCSECESEEPEVTESNPVCNYCVAEAAKEAAFMAKSFACPRDIDGRPEQNPNEVED